MFDNLSDRLSRVFGGLQRQGTLTEQEVESAMREVRIALLEADVALPVVKSFIRSASRRATGSAVLRSISPGDLVIKIVHDELIGLLKGDDDSDADLRINNPPATILVVGLQGSGKTTSTAKIAKFLSDRNQKKVLMASLDTRRPAAMEQLQLLGEQAEIDTLPIFAGLSATEITERAVRRCEIGGYDILLLDTAGRMHIDQELMNEVVEIRDIAQPRETLLVLDGLTGQDAVNTAGEFDSQIGVSGVVLTRMEGDGRGGAALSMRAVTGQPIRFVGTGEKIENIERFDPERVAGRILGMGDIVALVEKAAATIERESAERAAKRLQKGIFNLNDFRRQLESVEKMGGMQSVMSSLPGMGKFAAKLDQSGMDENMLRRSIAIINSMTRQERVNPSLLQASRRRRIAMGAGVTVSDVNQLIKTYKQLAQAMKLFAKKGRGGIASLLAGAGIMPGRMPGMPSPDMMPADALKDGNFAAEMQKLNSLIGKR
ncbi:MAG: signal recognition particle protein [Rhodobacteraceae bacterium]|nr:signal recognition particle protein [Paracoccaceae bacterium]MCY4197672.1 signal recognition particle protein [Paracoccaceae bacterium]